MLTADAKRERRPRDEEIPPPIPSVFPGFAARKQKSNASDLSSKKVGNTCSQNLDELPLYAKIVVNEGMCGASNTGYDRALDEVAMEMR